MGSLSRQVIPEQKQSGPFTILPVICPLRNRWCSSTAIYKTDLSNGSTGIFRMKIIRINHNFKSLSYLPKLRFETNARKPLYLYFGVTTHHLHEIYLPMKAQLLTQYYHFRAMPELYQMGNSHHHAVLRGMGSSQVTLTSMSASMHA